MDTANSVINVHIAVFFAEVPDTLKLAMALKTTFGTMFPNEPQMLPLPLDAPADAPRCIFQNEQGSANLTFGLSRMDIDNSIKAGTPWKNHVEIIELAFIAVCRSCDIKIKRLGIVVQSLISDQIIEETDNKIVFDDFRNSDEKHISWVIHEKYDDLLKFNINTNIQIQHNNPDAKGMLSLDVNTSVDSILPETDEELVRVIETMLTRLEEKMKNVF